MLSMVVMMMMVMMTRVRTPTLLRRMHRIQIPRLVMHKLLMQRRRVRRRDGAQSSIDRKPITACTATAGARSKVPAVRQLETAILHVDGRDDPAAARHGNGKQGRLVARRRGVYRCQQARRARTASRRG